MKSNTFLKNTLPFILLMKNQTDFGLILHFKSYLHTKSRVTGFTEFLTETVYPLVMYI